MKIKFNNPLIEYKDSNGTKHVLTEQARQMTLDTGSETNDPTASGNKTRLSLAGLKTWSLSLTLFQDFESAAEVDGVLFDELRKKGEITFIPNRTKATGKGNPVYNGDVYLTSYAPFGQEVGAVVTIDVEFTAASSLRSDTVLVES